MKKVYIVLFITMMLVVPVMAMNNVRHHNMENSINHALKHMHMKNCTKEKIMSMISTSKINITNVHEGNLFTYINLPGVYKTILLKIGGYGSETGKPNSTSFGIVNNNTNIRLNLTYYPRNVTLYVTGYSWWNSSNQKIVNNTDYEISSVSDSDGSFSISDTYTSVNPIWQSKGGNITVNTTLGALAWSDDTIAGTESVIYNITINDGNITSLVWNNVSVYVAPNTSVGTGQDDIAIYYSTDGGSTWNTIFTAADGSTSTGTQWTGTHSLPVSGNKTVLIKIEFTSDGANDNLNSPDIYINAIDITGTVSKLPTRNPKICVNGKYYNYTTGFSGLANGTTIKFDLGNNVMNLTNTISISAEGSQKVGVKLTWNDENRTAIREVSIENKTYNFTPRFISNGEYIELNFTNAKSHGRIPLFIELDNHTTMDKFNYTLSVDTYRWEGVSHGMFVVDPNMGATFSNVANNYKPIPLFVRPENSSCTCNVSWFNPETSDVNSTVLNMTAGSTHGNVVHFIVGNITHAKNVSLFVDGKLVKIISVYNDTCYFNWSNWSTHTLTLKVYSSAGAVVSAPQGKFTIWKFAAIITIIVLGMVLVILILEIYRGKIKK